MVDSESRSTYQTIDQLDENNKPKLKRWLFISIQMFISFAQNLAFQFLPIYNRKLGANEIQMGLLTSVQNVGSTLFSPIFGKASDKYGRRLFLALGSIIAAGSTVGMVIAENPNQIIFTVGINAFGMSIIIPAWAGAQADYTSGESRGGFVGRLMGVGAAFVTISLVAYALISPQLDISELDNYRLIIAISAVSFGLVVILSFFYLDIKRSVKKSKTTIFTPLKDQKFRQFLIVILIWWLGMSFAWSYFPIVISDVLVATVSQVAWIGIMATVTQAVASFKMADLIDKMGPRKSVVIGFLPFTLIPLLFAVATEWWHILVPQFIAGIGFGLGFAALQVYILNQAGSEKAGNYQGTYNLFWGLVTFGGSYAGGYALSKYLAHTGDLNIAIRDALFFIAALRLLTNIMLWKFLPTPDKNG